MPLSRNVTKYERGPVVEHLSSKQAVSAAAGALSLLHASYGVQLERRQRIMPEGTLLSSGYDPHAADDVARQARRIAAHTDKGSCYSVIRDPERNERLLGLIKVSPGDILIDDDDPPTYVRQFNNTLYIHDIMVHPTMQGRGYGAHLVHAMLTNGHHTPAKPLLLEGFRRNPGVNNWFKRGLGLVFAGESPEPTVFGAYTADMDYYRSPQGETYEHSIVRLEERYSTLRTGKIVSERC